MNPACSRSAWASPVLIGLGGATGTLLYPLISGHGRPEPLKAVAIGAFVGLTNWLVSRALRALRALRAGA